MAKKADIAKLLCRLGLCKSMSMARRVVYQEAVSINGKTVEGIENPVDVNAGDTVAVGKHLIIKAEVKANDLEDK